METKKVERNKLIATRLTGDTWTLVDDLQKVIHQSLTDTLEAYFERTEFKGNYRLEPLNSKLYAIVTSEEVIEKPKPKSYNIYGEVE